MLFFPPPPPPLPPLPYPSSEDEVECVGMPLPTPAPYFSRSAPLDSFGDCGRLYEDFVTEDKEEGSTLGLVA